MAKQDSSLILKILLPDDFEDVITTAMEEEFSIASHKWNVFLSNEAKEEIFRHAKKQLSTKVASVTKSNWDFGSVLFVKISDAKASQTIHLPFTNGFPEQLDNHIILRGSNEWKLTDEQNDKTVLLSNFYEYILNNLENWVRTAVFYGVGSYTA